MDTFESDAEEAAYQELRSRIESDVPLGIRDDKHTYIRFLRARNGNVNQAENMLRNHLTWRSTWQIDTQDFKEYEPDEALQKYTPYSQIGFDREGCPLNYIDLGNSDPKGFHKSFKKNDVSKLLFRYFEDDVAVMKEQSQKLGKHIDRWTCIINFENATFSQVTHKEGVETLIHLVAAYEANYPERLKEAIIINASIYFSMLYSILKPLLSSITVKKIHIYSKDGWKDHILRLVSPEVLPSFLGGTRTDPDGNSLCQTFIRHAQKVPEECYMKRDSNRLKGQPGVQKLTTSRMSKMRLEVFAPEEGSTLEWTFETECRDIGFCVLLKRIGDDRAVEVVPQQRLDAHLVSEAGLFRCREPGMYIIVFDNSYSWLYKKEIYFKIEIVTPDGKRTPVKK